VVGVGGGGPGLAGLCMRASCLPEIDTAGTDWQTMQARGRTELRLAHHTTPSRPVPDSPCPAARNRATESILSYPVRECLLQHHDKLIMATRDHQNGTLLAC
jgi:hypothetical protein